MISHIKTMIITMFSPYGFVWKISWKQHSKSTDSLWLHKSFSRHKNCQNWGVFRRAPTSSINIEIHWEFMNDPPNIQKGVTTTIIIGRRADVTHEDPISFLKVGLPVPLNLMTCLEKYGSQCEDLQSKTKPNVTRLTLTIHTQLQSFFTIFNNMCIYIYIKNTHYI